MVHRALRPVTWRVTAGIRRQPLVGARHRKQEDMLIMVQQRLIRRASNTRTTPPNQTGSSLKLLNHSSAFWNNQREVTILGRRIVKVSLSETAGHLSFLFLGLGYLETDVLPLRIYATAGISCSIAFQYYRPEPLSIAISWNTIFLVINGFMVALLIKERYDARQQDQETSNLYDQVFRESGLTPVDFMKIIGISKTIKLAPGEVLARQDKLQEKLYLVLEGELQVSKNGQPIASVCAGDFAGEMSFLRYVKAEANLETEGCQSTAAADVIVTSSGAKVKSWDFDELHEMLSDHLNMSVCFHATLASTMASKLVVSNDPAIRYRLLMQGILIDGVVTTVEKEALDKARKMLGVDDDTHTRELKAAGWSAREFEQGYHDKLSCREYETLVKDVLRGGVVDDAGRTKLREYRMAKGIDALDHVRVLKTLGWTLNDLEAGRRLNRISVSGSSDRIGGADQPSTEAQGVAPRASSKVDEKRSPT